MANNNMKYVRYTGTWKKVISITFYNSKIYVSGKSVSKSNFLFNLCLCFLVILIPSAENAISVIVVVVIILIFLVSYSICSYEAVYSIMRWVHREMGYIRVKIQQFYHWIHLNRTLDSSIFFTQTVNSERQWFWMKCIKWMENLLPIFGISFFLLKFFYVFFGKHSFCRIFNYAFIHKILLNLTCNWDWVFYSIFNVTQIVSVKP